MLEVHGDCKKPVLGKGNWRIAVPDEPTGAYLSVCGHLLDGFGDDGNPVPGEKPNDHGSSHQGKDELDHQDAAKACSRKSGDAFWGQRLPGKRAFRGGRRGGSTGT